MRLLKEVPERFAVVGEAASAEVFMLFWRLQELGVFSQVLVDLISTLLVRSQTTRFHEQLVYTPISQLVTEGQHTHVVQVVQLACSRIVTQIY